MAAMRRHSIYEQANNRLMIVNPDKGGGTEAARVVGGVAQRVVGEWHGAWEVCGT